MAALARRHHEITSAGFRVAAVDIDSPQRHAAMVEKLRLPFPMLSDPDRSRAIEPLGLSDHRDPRNLALPALVAVEPGPRQVYRFVSRDYADRRPEDDLIKALNARGRPPTHQPEPAPGDARPGPRAMPLEAMIPYFRGGKFAALALGLRHRRLGEEFKSDAKAFVAEMDRFVEAVKEVRGST